MEGMRRARGAVDNAHLAIFVVDWTNAEGAGELLTQLRKEAAAAGGGEEVRDREGEMLARGGGGGGGGYTCDDACHGHWLLASHTNNPTIAGTE